MLVATTDVHSQQGGDALATTSAAISLTWTGPLLTLGCIFIAVSWVYWQQQQKGAMDGDTIHVQHHAQQQAGVPESQSAQQSAEDDGNDTGCENARESNLLLRAGSCLTAASKPKQRVLMESISQRGVLCSSNWKRAAKPRKAAFRRSFGMNVTSITEGKENVCLLPSKHTVNHRFLHRMSKRRKKDGLSESQPPAPLAGSKHELNRFSSTQHSPKKAKIMLCSPLDLLVASCSPPFIQNVYDHTAVPGLQEGTTSNVAGLASPLSPSHAAYHFSSLPETPLGCSSLPSSPISWPTATYPAALHSALQQTLGSLQPSAIPNQQIDTSHDHAGLAVPSPTPQPPSLELVSSTCPSISGQAHSTHSQAHSIDPNNLVHYNMNLPSISGSQPAAHSSALVQTQPAGVEHTAHRDDLKVREQGSNEKAGSKRRTGGSDDEDEQHRFRKGGRGR